LPEDGSKILWEERWADLYQVYLRTREIAETWAQLEQQEARFKIAMDKLKGHSRPER
jgi:hypothetical protein